MLPQIALILINYATIHELIRFLRYYFIYFSDLCVSKGTIELFIILSRSRSHLVYFRNKRKKDSNKKDDAYDKHAHDETHKT